MRILISNDDGIHAPGLAIMRELAAALSDDVWVVAPETDQSGLAHSLTLSQPLRSRRVEDKVFAVSGTPTDCVIMGIRQIVEGPVDLVLSGVNAGQNVGDYVTYSGTVAAAMEGALLGVRSIALSQAFDFGGSRKIDWETTRRHAPALLDRLITLDLPRDTLINVNFPACGPDQVEGEVVGRQGKFEHGLGIGERKDGRGLPYYWLEFQGDPPRDQPGTDIAALAANKIAVTPLHTDMTHHDLMAKVAETLG
ncbi:5'/3'-nucleotidase SurE [Rhizobiaceae bacterium]|nr:5'/3'-nucleotidase SurE [Rhizobiaceae bacterium]